MIFTIRPLDGWQPGNRAYCTRGSRRTKPTLETGKVYIVANVIPVPSCVDDGLILSGIVLPEGMDGIWSGRFVKLYEGESSLSRIGEATTPVWLESYRASTAQPKQGHPQ